MEFYIELQTIKMGWSIVYIEGSQVIISPTPPKNCIFSLKMDFVMANSVDPDEMPHDAAFHQGLHCLPKHLFRYFSSSKGLTAKWDTAAIKHVNIGFTHVFSCINIWRVPRMLFEHKTVRPSVQTLSKGPACVIVMKQTCVFSILAYST